MATIKPKPVIRPVARFKISDSVAAQIEQMIASGSYEPGDQLLSERVLSEQFGVGRSSMREALRALEARGFVSIVHGLGVYVSDRPANSAAAGLLVLDEGTVPELFEVRRALECPAAAAAAKRVSPSEAARLEEIVAEMNNEGLTDEEYVQKDAELHMTIMLATHNALLIKLYETTRHLFIEYSARVIQFPRRRVIAQEGHEAIVDAIVRRRPQAAEKAMSAHLLDVEKEIVERLDVAPSQAAPDQTERKEN